MEKALKTGGNEHQTLDFGEETGRRKTGIGDQMTDLFNLSIEHDHAPPTISS